MKIAIYISNYNSIGGVERFVENFCKRMSRHYRVDFYYDTVDDIKQLFELSEYVNVIRVGLKIEEDYDVCIYASSWSKSPNGLIKAKKYIQVIHADYLETKKNWNYEYKKYPLTTHHVAVGELVKKSFETITPYKIDKIIYNLLDDTQVPKPKAKNKKLTLITVSRYAKEKGFDRMLKLAKLLDNQKIDYIWNVYCNITDDLLIKFKDCKNVNFKGVVRKPYELINQSDYLVQLSDTEGFAYSVYEALQMKTPCIITPFKSGNEQITDGVNGYIVPFDMNNIDLGKIVNNIPKVKDFKEIGSEQSWIDFINEITK